jgi:hypothetical protein
MATPGLELDRGLEETMATEEFKSVLEILAQYESMPFLELTALSDIDDERLGQIIDVLERRGIVKVTSRENILDQIVTLKEKTSVLASSAP